MKILFFASDFNIGLSSLLTDQLIAFAKNGLEIYPIAGEREQETGLTAKLSAESIYVERIKGLDEHCNFKQLALQLKKIILQKQINIIHVQNNWQLALISYVRYCCLPKYKFKVIYTLHGFRHNSPIKAYVAQLVIGIALFLFVDKVICMSNYLKKKFILLSYKICLIPLGVSDNFFYDSHPSIIGKGLQMVFPAQFRKGKRQDMIVKAFAKHIKNTSDNISTLILPGSGPLLKDMQQLALFLKIEDRIIFPGQCSKEEIKQWYLKSNIGIIASNSETFGQSIVEPFILGRCIVTTPVGIAPDIIKQKENGFFFRNEKDLIQTFSLLYKSPKLIVEPGIRNYNQRYLFHWNHIAQLYKKEIL